MRQVRGAVAQGRALATRTPTCVEDGVKPRVRYDTCACVRACVHVVQAAAKASYQYFEMI